MPRILFVSTSTTLGGAEKTLFSLVTLIDPREFQVAGVVGLKAPGHYARRLAELGFPVRSLGIQRRPGLKDAKALAALIRRERPDIVHAVMYQAIQLCRYVKKRAGAPFKLISSPRVNYRTRPAWTLAVDRLLKKADDLVITESQSSREFLLRKQGYAEQRVKTIYNGVDIAAQPAAPLERRSRRSELRLAEDDVLLGTIGRLDAQKGHNVLIDALARLRDRVPARCAIIGEGPLRCKLEAQIRRLKLQDRVWLLGERDDAAGWLSAFDLFVLPSLWEGLPNALLEAMARGLPVAASAVDGIPEAVTDGRQGLLVPPDDPGALAEAMTKLASDPELRQRLGQEARARIARDFSVRSMISGYETAYRELLGRPRPIL